MDFSGANSNLQQRMAASCAGVNRRQSVLNALDIQIGQKILDIGCGGGHLLEEIALSVGPTGKSFGLDPSETQITSAKDRCIQLKNVEFLCQGAEKINLPNNFFDSITSTQTLEYIENVDSVLVEAKRLLKSGGKFVNVSVLWDHFKFHGPENERALLLGQLEDVRCDIERRLGGAEPRQPPAQPSRVRQAGGARRARAADAGSRAARECRGRARSRCAFQPRRAHAARPHARLRR